MSKKNEFIGTVQVFGAFTLAGSSIVVGKLITDKVPVFVTVYISLLLAVLVLFPFQIKRIRELKQLRKEDYLNMLLQALTGVVLTRLFTLAGLKYTSPLDAGLINSTIPGVMIFFSMFFLKEVPGLKSIVGISLGVIGLAVVSVSSESIILNGSFGGNLLVFLSVLSEVLMTVFRKKSKKNICSVTNTFILFSISLILLIPFVVYEVSSFPLAAIDQNSWLFLVLYGVFGSAIAYLLWGAGVVKVSSARVGIGFTMIPLTAVILSAIIFRESFTVFHFIGALFCLSGVVLCNLKRRGVK